MPPSYTGSCKCGAIQIELQGEPAFVGTCHCHNCRKSSGSTYSTNAVFSDSAFSVVQGKPKVYELVGGSGNPASVYFCDHCSATMWTKTSVRPEIVVIKMGILDGDAMEKLVPKVETFTTRRPSWVKSVDGAVQCDEGVRPTPQS